MRKLLLTCLALVWVTIAGAQAVISIPLTQFPPLKVVAGTVTVSLDDGNNLLGSDLVVEGGDGTYSYRWTDADGKELGTEATLQVSKAGKYILAVIDGHHCQVSTMFTVTGTSGIAALQAAGVHADVADGRLTVRYDATPDQLRIVNSAGQLVWKSSTLPAHTFTVDLAMLPAGVYTLCVVAADEKAIAVKFKN